MQSKVTVLLSAAVLVAVSVFAQQPDPVGVEFRVNSHVLKDQIRPRLAHQPDGGFIVVWDSDESGVGGTDTMGCILGQRYGSDGTRVGNEFQVNTSTPYYQWGADIGTDAAGNFVVVWASPHLGVDGGGFRHLWPAVLGQWVGCRRRVSGQYLHDRSSGGSRDCGGARR